MTRPDLMKAMVAIYGSRRAVAEVLGVSVSSIAKIQLAQRPLNDAMAAAMVRALTERAGEADKLADTIDQHVRAKPVRSLRGTQPRDAAGMFA